MLDTDDVDKNSAGKVAAMWPGGAVSLRPLLPDGCEDVRDAAVVWDAQFRPLGKTWTVEKGEVLRQMLHVDVSHLSQNKSG